MTQTIPHLRKNSLLEGLKELPFWHPGQPPLLKPAERTKLRGLVGKAPCGLLGPLHSLQLLSGRYVHTTQFDAIFCGVILANTVVNLGSVAVFLVSTIQHSKSLRVKGCRVSAKSCSALAGLMLELRTKLCVPQLGKQASKQPGKQAGRQASKQARAQHEAVIEV